MCIRCGGLNEIDPICFTCISIRQLSYDMNKRTPVECFSEQTQTYSQYMNSCPSELMS